MTIERTFEALLEFVSLLDEEQNRAVREGLDEPTLALFDLLKKDELTPAEIKDIKQVATALHAKLEAEFARIREWHKKEATRDGVKRMILDFLYQEDTGLPSAYSQDEVVMKSDMVFGHFMARQQQAPTFGHGLTA